MAHDKKNQTKPDEPTEKSGPEKASEEMAKGPGETRDHLDSLERENQLLREQLELRGRLADSGEAPDVQNEIAALRKELDELRTSSRSQIAETKTALEYLQEEESAHRDRQQRIYDEALEELQTGERYFKVKLASCREMLVGANSEDEARGKYLRFYRINATGHPVQVIPIEDIKKLSDDERKELSKTHVA